MTRPPGTFAEFSHTYAALPGRFYARVPPTTVAAPSLIAFNDRLACELRVDRSRMSEAELAAVCVGNRLPAGALPLAMAYAGHQFGSFVPQLGDGRALLIGEVIDAHGQRRDLQWKGAGPTPYSRRGDGRAALGPVLREYLVSEAMHALGVPTTRALSAATTGEHVLREDGPLPGAVLIRVAASHVRIGTFEYFAARGDVDGVRTLADHVIARHYPELADEPDRYFALFEGVAERQSSLVARWMQVGFIHGVMNTDNMTISGETIDFGPCAFMDDYDPATVYSYIDRRGRYAYGNQPDDPAVESRTVRRDAAAADRWRREPRHRACHRLVQGVSARFDRHWLRRHSGASSDLQASEAGDEALVTDLLDVMQCRSGRLHQHLSCAGRGGDGRRGTAGSRSPPGSRRWHARLAREPGGVGGRAATLRAPTRPTFRAITASRKSSRPP